MSLPRNAFRAGWGLVLLLAAAAIAPAWAQEGPRELVERTTEQALSRLEAQREQIEAEPHRLYGLVEDIVLPHFDFVRMSQWVLGRRHWIGASDEEKRRFVRAFRDLLVRTYATALFEYTGQAVNVLPLRGDPEEGDVRVQTEVQSEGGPIAINYRMYRNKRGEWKVYDLSVEGVSLLSSYRSSFASELRNTDLESLIQRLEQRAKEGGA